jgi:beta-lactamase class A
MERIRLERIRHETLTAVVAVAAVTVAAITVAAGGLAAASAAPALAAPSRADAPARATSICTSAKHPRLAASISRGITAALAGRTDSVVGLTAADPAEDLSCGFQQKVHFYAASVIKVTIISALLRKVHGPSGMTKAQRNLAYLMITQSSNSAAQRLWVDVGMTDMEAFLNKAGMRHTILSDAWGLTQITAQDELRLLQVLTTRGKVLSKASRRYVLGLMANVIASERWGVPAGAPSDVTVHVKNGWLPYPRADDWRINSIGAFTGKGIGYQIVILTGPAARGQGESYGIETVQLAADVINRILARRQGAASSASPAQPNAAALAAPGG